LKIFLHLCLNLDSPASSKVKVSSSRLRVNRRVIRDKASSSSRRNILEIRRVAIRENLRIRVNSIQASLLIPDIRVSLLTLVIRDSLLTPDTRVNLPIPVILDTRLIRDNSIRGIRHIQVDIPDTHPIPDIQATRHIRDTQDFLLTPTCPEDIQVDLEVIQADLEVSLLILKAKDLVLPILGTRRVAWVVPIPDTWPVIPGSPTLDTRVASHSTKDFNKDPGVIWDTHRVTPAGLRAFKDQWDPVIRSC